jgi:hypothetical protein
MENEDDLPVGDDGMKVQSSSAMAESSPELYWRSLATE